MKLKEIPNVTGKNVILRTDYNVPMLDGVILNDFRIKASLDTINYLLKHDVKRIVILSHLGRPKGFDEKLSLKPIAKRLSELLNEEVNLVMLENLLGSSGKITMLENVRFWKDEENDSNLAEIISQVGDLFIFDAFSVAHRAHASTVGITKFLPSYPGLLVKKEVEALSKITENPKRPFVAIMGGAKISTKLPVILKLSEMCDKVVIGGAMVFTIYSAMGHKIGNSLFEKDMVKDVLNVYDKIKDKILLPKDQIIAKNIDSQGKVSGVDIEEGYAGYDIGPESIKEIEHVIKNAKTILWNGPMGVFENEHFEKGTKEIVRMLEKSKAFRVLGGGETTEAVEKWSSFDKFDHVSTGGGALLKFIQNQDLPALIPLKKE